MEAANTYLNLGWESFPSSDGQDSANRAMTPAASRSLLTSRPDTT